MIGLRLYYMGQPLSELRLTDKLIRIGRERPAQVVLPDSLISEIHCVLQQKEGGDWYLQDLSSNGIFIEDLAASTPFSFDERLATEAQRLRPGFCYHLSRRYGFEWLEDSETKSRTSEKTLIESREPTQLISSNWDAETLSVAKPVLWIHRPDGQKERFVMRSPSLSLGSHPGNQIVLAGANVSAYHAKIEMQKNRYRLIDLGSTNGTFVNGTRVSGAELLGEVLIQLGQVQITWKLEREEIALKPYEKDQLVNLTGRSRKMRKVFAMAETVADSDVSVFVTGETGTGKELLARAIHTLSLRSKRPFIALNCSALPENLIEAELFGHERGAFTGAIQARDGAFQSADGGSLFLDEVADLSLTAQAKLLRALESGEVKKVGANQTTRVDVRLLAATHKDLRQEVNAGRFREDLFFRLHVVPIPLPPLRERAEDIPLLVDHLMKQMKLPYQVSEPAMEKLKRQPFPGNVRELKNILQRACVEYQIKNPSVEAARILESDHFFFLKDNGKATESEEEFLRERDRLLDLLESSGHNQSQVARRLAIPISTLHDRLRKYKIKIKARLEASGE